MVEILVEVLVSNGAEEAFDFSFGGTIADGGVDEDGAEAGADLAELFGGVVGAVIGVDGLWDASFVEGVLEALDEVLGVVGVEELGVGDDAGGVVDEGDEVNLEGVVVAGEAEIGSVEGVGLPEVVGVGFGEGEAAFWEVGGVGFEKFVFFDGTTKGVGGDLITTEVALFDAGAVEGLDVEGAFGVLAGATGVEGREGFFDGGEEVFGGDFAQGVFVGPGRRIGDAVLSVVIPPGLDGAPGEVVRVAVFVGEGHF